MKKLLTTTCLLAAALCAPLAQAQTHVGPYLVASAGVTQYDYDCYFFSSCDKARANAVKLGGGYRFGVFALEGWLSDYGRATIRYAGSPTQASLRVRGAGITGAWMMQFAPTVHGLLRAGGGQMQQKRSDDVDSSGFEGMFGLALLVDLSPAMAVEAAYDVTTATGQNSGSVLAQGLTVGLRLRF